MKEANAVSTHIFEVGDIVTYRSAMGSHSGGAFEIIRLLPTDTPEPVYRIKSVGQPFERAVMEHEIRLVPRAERLAAHEPKADRPRK